MVVKKNAKQGTRGIKQIAEENESTISFYWCLSSIVVASHFIINLFFIDFAGTTSMVLFVLSIIIHLASNKLFRYAAKVIYDENGKMTDCGTDLNINGGIAEHIKDMVILTSIAQILSLISNYFWLLLLLAPFRAIFMLWKSVLAPWIFQPDNKNNDLEETRRQRKMKYI